jgi:IrrE N-terminal-like domain
VSDNRRPSDPRADDLRRRYQLTFGQPDSIPVPVEAIATDLLGLWVQEVDDLPVSGALIPAERTVLINRSEPPERRRFTLAHELGHWVCQCDEGRAPLPIIMCRGADMEEQAARELEGEANRFAATLLMPDEHFTHKFAAAAVPDLATRFGVSSPAMEWRLFNAGLAPNPPQVMLPRGDVG